MIVTRNCEEASGPECRIGLGKMMMLFVPAAVVAAVLFSGFPGASLVEFAGELLLWSAVLSTGALFLWLASGEERAGKPAEESVQPASPRQ